MNFVQSTASRLAIRLSGAVYTPPEIAAAIISVVKDTLPSKQLTILEPSVGDGAFVREMGDLLIGNKLIALDIDPNVISIVKNSSIDRTSNSEFIVDDFINYATSCIRENSPPADLILGNPPFIRKHNFSEKFKENIEELATLTEYPLKDLKNSWVAFLIASSKIVSEAGVVAFVLPYELLTVAYGQKALQTISREFERVDIFVSKGKAFPGLDQDAIIFIGYKISEKQPGLHINHVDHMSDLKNAKVYNLSLNSKNTNSLELNSFLLPPAALDLLKTLRSSCPIIQDYAGSAPGIVSAANNFFILKKSDVNRIGVESNIIKVLKKGRLASYKPIFTADDFSELEEKQPCYLLSLKGDFSNLDSNIQAYVREGEKKGFHLRYKCRNRKNWFEVPIVPPEQGFFFKRSHEFPRVFLNEANVYLTDTAYGIKVRDGFTMKGLCYSFYNSLTFLFAETDGRFYGGGVLELSPTEFRGLPLVYHEPTPEEFSEFLEIHLKAKGCVEQILDFGDSWLMKKLGLSKDKLRIIRQAWVAVRNHRMRHSGRQVHFPLEVNNFSAPPLTR